MPGPPRNGDADELLAADVLGAFGVTAADIERVATRSTTDASNDGDGRSLEAALATVLDDGRDKTTILRETIARSNRGLSCAARYPQEAVKRELTAVFESIGWSLSLERAITAAPRDRLELRAVDPEGRQREATFEYPETPLGTDNLPAVLWSIEESLLAGTQARFVLLSGGDDRWRAALVDERELERLQERYGRRIAPFERPVVPECGLALEAYVPGSEDSDTSAPWPAWAADRESSEGSRFSKGQSSAERGEEGVASLIEEAESGSIGEAGSRSRSGSESESEPTTDARKRPTTDARKRPTSTPSTPSTTSTPSTPSTTSTTSASETDPNTTRQTSPPSTEADGFELRGGSPSVSRVSEDGSDNSNERRTDDSEHSSQESGRAARVADAFANAEDPRDGESRGATSSGDERTGRSNDDPGLGSLSGSSDTARVSNDAFGSGLEWESEDDRYRALGAALGAGGNVSVEGLLEDDDFLPELPAAEPDETRIEFADEFDPGAVQQAKAAAEQSGFVWVDSGSLETTRVSNK
ncbi:hypothetical protein [Halobiforma nitratireducens]|uniref:Uncharacterized protein n=1 Tax=Halobiforma nitratireducens JCM 10879 TaxID=1227454 RepID=M0LCL1_9EURY|nr:hypothetical protein [Halobiforma nitratireducens]EMA31321.1 hypothetical protein C446_15805 [Halobiforma nitratireducens JCM 10879]